MSWMYKSFFLLSVLSLSKIGALSLHEVKERAESLFRYHIMEKKFSPKVARRSLALFLEGFDPDGTYLLQKEVSRYLNPSKRDLEKIVERYEKGDFTDYMTIHQLIKKSIQRARDLREEIRRNQEWDIGNSSFDFGYPNGELRLKKRIAREIKKALLIGGERGETREHTLARFETSQRLMEEKYLFLKEDGGEGKTGRFTLDLLKAIAASLDPHTKVYSQEEANGIRERLLRQFEGIGVVLEEREGVISIKTLIEGSVAQRSNEIEKGDTLIAIDEQSIDGLSFEEVLKRLEGKEGEEVHLCLKRGNGFPFDVLLIREKITLKEDRLHFSTESFGGGVIGKLTLPAFYEGEGGKSAESDVKEALKQMRQKGPIEGLVLDLRENPGGFLSQAIKVASLFLTDGVIIISKYSDGEIRYTRDTGQRVYYEGPLVVLTSKASASASEIVAEVLKEYGKALIVGDERTYGKGSMQYQTLTDENAESFFKVTVGKYYTLFGTSPQMEGVKADIVVPTDYHTAQIGERFLRFALKGGCLSPQSFRKRKKGVKDLFPSALFKRDSKWTPFLLKLKRNSATRVETNANFQTFLKERGQKKRCGVEDLQMQESVNIIKDMIFLSKNRSLYP